MRDKNLMKIFEREQLEKAMKNVSGEDMQLLSFIRMGLIDSMQADKMHPEKYGRACPAGITKGDVETYLAKFVKVMERADR